MYEALDLNGHPYLRAPLIVGELPRRLVFAALAEATRELERTLGFPAVRCVQYGTPVFSVFSMNRLEAKGHWASSVLLQPGERLSLSLVPGVVV